MPFTVQQTNAASRLLARLEDLRQAYYEAREERDRTILLGIPVAGDYPPPGDLSHLDVRAKHVNAAGVITALETWMGTAIDLGAGAARKPIDAIVEALR